MDAIDRGLGELMDDDRRARAVGARRRLDLHRAVEQDTATFVGILRDLAEHQIGIVLEQDGGRVAGRVLGLGADHVVVQRRGTSDRSVLRLDAVIAVTADAARVGPGARGRRAAPSDVTVREVLVDAMEHRADIRVHLAGRTEVLAGTVRSVGEDVAVIGPGGPIGATQFVPLHRVVRVDLEA